MNMLDFLAVAGDRTQRALMRTGNSDDVVLSEEIRAMRRLADFVNKTFSTDGMDVRLIQAGNAGIEFSVDREGGTRNIVRIVPDLVAGHVAKIDGRDGDAALARIFGILGEELDADTELVGLMPPDDRREGDVLSKIADILKECDRDEAVLVVNQAMWNIPGVAFLRKAGGKPRGLVFRVVPEDGCRACEATVRPVLGPERISIAVKGGREMREKAAEKLRGILLSDTGTADRPGM